MLFLFVSQAVRLNNFSYVSWSFICDSEVVTFPGLAVTEGLLHVCHWMYVGKTV